MAHDYYSRQLTPSSRSHVEPDTSSLAQSVESVRSPRGRTAEWLAAIAIALPFVERPSTTLAALVALVLSVVAATLISADLGSMSFSPYIPFVVYLWWAAISLSWSDQPEATITNAIVHATYIVTACCVVATVPRFADFGRAWRRAGYLYLSFSTAAALAFPRYGRLIDPPFTGQWRGLAAHKSGFGTFALLLGLPLLLDAFGDAEGGHRLLKRLAALGFCGVIVLSGSATAIVALVSAMVFKVVLYRRPDRGLRGRGVAYITIPLAGAAATLLWPLADDAATAVGRDPSLTGRTELWSIVLKQVERRPLQGFGFHAQWHEPSGVTLRIWNSIHLETPWTPAIAHNSGLEVLLSLGVVGLAFLLFGYVQTAIRALRFVSLDRTAFAILPLLALMVLTCYSVSERGIGQDQGFFFLVLLASALAVAKNRHRSEPSGVRRPRHTALE